MRDLLVIVPSRGRPDVFNDFCEAFFGTARGDTDLLIGLDDDDVEYDIPKGYEGRLIVDVNPRLRLGGTLNLLANKYAGYYENLAFMGDDHRPRTFSWDEIYVEELRRLGEGFVYGDDQIWGEGLPTQVAMTSSIVKKLGYMVPPGMIHLYLDNFWLTLGRAIGKISYLSHVIVEHLHPSVGKAEWTPEYQAVNSQEIYDGDKARFDEYMSSQFLKDVEKLK